MLLSALKARLGSLEKVKRVIKVNGFVNCSDDFEMHPQGWLFFYLSPVIHCCLADLLCCVCSDQWLQ